MSRSADGAAASWTTPYRSPRRVLRAAGRVLVALFAAAVTLSDLTDEDHQYTFFFVLISLFLVHRAGSSVFRLRGPRQSTRRPPVARNDVKERGLAFRYSWWAHYWYGSVRLLGGIACMYCAVVFTLDGAGEMVPCIVCLLVGGVYLLWFLGVSLRLAPGLVVLSSSGIYHRSPAFEHFVPWEAIDSVQAYAGPAPVIAVAAHSSLQTRRRNFAGPLNNGVEGLPWVVIQSSWLGPNTVGTYEAIRYYFDHPDERAELSLPAGPQMIEHLHDGRPLCQPCVRRVGRSLICSKQGEIWIMNGDSDHGRHDLAGLGRIERPGCGEERSAGRAA